MDLRTLAKLGRYALDDDYRKEQNEDMKEGCSSGIIMFVAIPWLIWVVTKYYKFVHSLPIFAKFLEMDTSENFLLMLIVFVVTIVIPTGILFLLIGIVITIIVTIAEYFEK